MVSFISFACLRYDGDDRASTAMRSAFKDCSGESNAYIISTSGVKAKAARHMKCKVKSSASLYSTEY